MIVQNVLMIMITIMMINMMITMFLMILADRQVMVASAAFDGWLQKAAPPNTISMYYIAIITIGQTISK